MRFPTVILEGKKLPRMIFSIRPLSSRGDREIYRLMERTYEMGAWCYDLPSANHFASFKEFKNLTGEETLIGLPRLEPEAGVSFLGKPLHRFESKIVSTVRKVLPSYLLRNILLPSSSSEVFTQKEIDRISLDPLRFDEAISPFDPKDFPFLLFGEKYGDWLLALGRIDLLHEMVARIREKGLIPIFSGQWTTFTLPKAKPLHVAAFAMPINKKLDFFGLPRAFDLIKKFDRPVIGLNPLADGFLLAESREAFSLLFDELKVHAAITGIASEEEARIIVGVLKNLPSVIPPRKT
jgi:hypothetical protein